MKLNKYLSFDISLHETLYNINKYYSNECLSYSKLLSILKNNWLSKGYQSNREEAIFKTSAIAAIKTYYNNPLDKGTDIVLLNKFISDTEDCKFKYAKIDKLHFLSKDTLELLDYKTGKHINPINEFFYTDKTLFTINSIEKKLGVYPNIFSLYYLRYGIKFSLKID